MSMNLFYEKNYISLLLLTLFNATFFLVWCFARWLHVIIQKKKLDSHQPNHIQQLNSIRLIKNEQGEKEKKMQWIVVII